LPQPPVNLSLIGPGKLAADAFAGQVASELVQFQGDLQPLLARHASVALDLSLKGRFRCHVPSSGGLRGSAGLSGD
jgi:hypothetical protein